jgi:ADP-ribosyl-[dinitrogen reductase] hydrolase
MKGSCLCGAVAYEVRRPTAGLHIGLCSCRSCRKAHAAPFNVYASVPRENFRWLQGEDKTRIFESSPGKNRHFCSVCGSQLIAEHPGESNVLLRVALLDDDPGARPVEHIFRGQQVPWCDWESDAIARYEEWGPSGEPTARNAQ